jgi:tripartite-type tricarboxylate transporter receptor subunit TctC
MKKFIAALIMLPIVAASSFAAGPADNFPNKPIHMIVPYPPGGGFDVVARLIGNKLAERLKQTVIIENRAGANGNIGAMAVAKSAGSVRTRSIRASTTTVASIRSRISPRSCWSRPSRISSRSILRCRSRTSRN